MNIGLKNSISFISQIVPLSWMIRRGKAPIFLPFYHIVSDNPISYINSYRIRTEQDFEKELDFLLKYYEAVSLEDIMAKSSKQKMHLSFDDGLKECYSVIAPILKRKGIPATFFINPTFVDNAAVFHRFKHAILRNQNTLVANELKSINDVGKLDQIATEKGIVFSGYDPYLSFDEISSLKNDGFLIGAHSMNHPEMWMLSEEEQYQQIKQSMEWVVSNFNPSIKAFSFPFTDDQISIDLFERINSELITDVTFGTAGLKFDSAPNNFQRIPVELHRNWSIKRTLHFEYFYGMLRSLVGRNIVTRQK